MKKNSRMPRWSISPSWSSAKAPHGSLTGIGPLDSKGRGEVCAIDVPIECAGVTVNPGDLVFGDADGVVVVPQPIVVQTIKQALEKVEGEDRTRAELQEGALLADVFKKYGIL